MYNYNYEIACVQGIPFHVHRSKQFKIIGFNNKLHVLNEHDGQMMVFGSKSCSHIFLMKHIFVYSLIHFISIIFVKISYINIFGSVDNLN